MNRAIAMVLLVLSATSVFAAGNPAPVAQDMQMRELTEQVGEHLEQRVDARLIEELRNLATAPEPQPEVRRQLAELGSARAELMFAEL